MVEFLKNEDFMKTFPQILDRVYAVSALYDLTRAFGYLSSQDLRATFY